MLDNRFLSKSLGLLNPPPPALIQASAPVTDAIALLQEQKSGCVLVVDEQQLLVGIFTERDVVLRVMRPGIDPEMTPVSELMTKSPATASMTTSVAYALNMMSHGGFRNIPIVDETGHPVGLLAVKHIVDFLAQTIGRLQRD